MFNKIKCKMFGKCKREMEENDINKEQMDELIVNGAILIDVRSKQEYAEGHIDGAINIPDYEMYKRVENEVSDKDKTIILYCQNGSRSRKAGEKLRKLGYINVYNLYNGIENY